MKRRILVGLSMLLCVVVLSGCGGPDTRQLLTQGVSQLQTGRLDKAEATLKRVLAVEPSNPDALFYMAQVYQAREFYEMAVYYYQCCLSAAPGYPGVAEHLKKAQQQAHPAGAKLRFMPDLKEE